MTSRERAEKVWEKWDQLCAASLVQDKKVFESDRWRFSCLVTAAIDEAVAEENEECAKIADEMKRIPPQSEWGKGALHNAVKIGDLIRARRKT